MGMQSEKELNQNVFALGRLCLAQIQSNAGLRQSTLERLLVVIDPNGLDSNGVRTEKQKKNEQRTNVKSAMV